MIFVDRKNPQARRDTSEAIVNRTRTNIPEGFTIPEGPTILSPMMSPTHRLEYVCSHIAFLTLFIVIVVPIPPPEETL